MTPFMRKEKLDKSLTIEETRQVLTPFAFNIDESLFGIPLSKPWKRLVAILVDLMLITLLAETPSELLALVIAIVFFRLGNPIRTETLGKRYGFGRRMLRIIGAFIVFILMLTTWPDFFKHGDDMLSPMSETYHAIDAPTTKPTLEVIDQNIAHQNGGYLGLAWLKGIINDLGLSFGWAAVYFSIFTAIWDGQTPGKKLLGIRVLQLDGSALSVSDSFGRYGGYGAGIATGLLGFLQIFWDPNRQAIHDKIAATIVVDAKVEINWKPKTKVEFSK